MNDVRFRASHFYIEPQSEVLPQLLQHPYSHRGAGDAPASGTGGSKEKPRLSVYLISTLVTAITAAAIMFLAQPHIIHSSSGVHPLRAYISYDVLSATIRDLYVLFDESPSCTHAEILSPSNIISALTVPPRDTPSLWDRLSHGLEEDTGPRDATLRTDSQGVWDWTFPGANGQLGIRLNNDSLFLTTISLLMPASGDRRPPSCAPRDVVVWGILTQDANLSSVFDLHEGLTVLDDLAGTLPVGIPLPVHDERDTSLLNSQYILNYRCPVPILGTTFTMFCFLKDDQSLIDLKVQWRYINLLLVELDNGALITGSLKFTYNEDARIVSWVIPGDTRVQVQFWLDEEFLEFMACILHARRTQSNAPKDWMFQMDQCTKSFSRLLREVSAPSFNVGAIRAGQPQAEDIAPDARCLCFTPTADSEPNGDTSEAQRIEGD
ncbi:hypothetical protein LXA43DRAFT_1099655 [Ganoderma leucocontextum]|nr:hypothetical protein LXA43DRAFT_1099655 [Ganoderma leucocontextum]